MRKMQIGVIGSAGNEEYPDKKPSKKAFEFAYELGKLIAQQKAVLICGGKGGIMEEACRGAKEKNGITVGVISGNVRDKANKYVDVEVISGFVNCGEEALIVSMSDGLIAIGGGSGTLQEIAIAYRNNKPVVAIKNIAGWADRLAESYLDERGIIKIGSADSPQEAIDKIIKKIQKISHSTFSKS